jgi:ABC-2 type transport system permease protein
MNRGILLKSLREMLPVTLLLGAILLVAEAVLAYVMPTFQHQFSAQILRVELVQNVIKAMLGTDLSRGIGPEIFTAIPWVHPVVLAIVWAHAIISCTRVPAGEVDRGTIDVLLGLPVSRWGLYLTESVVILLGAVIVLLCAVLGNALGISRVQNAVPPETGRVFIVMLNLLCVYIAVGACAWLFSALSDRRGRAMGVVFVLVIASFLLNYLAQFWKPADNLSFLSVLSYYRPLPVLHDGIWPRRDMLILLSAAAVMWTAGGIIFSRRDLSTL